jgi:alpha-tubulin suppressor-like RCC1 family protein
VLTTSGRVLCWGENSRGQVGIDKRTHRGEVTAPVELGNMTDVRQIDMGAAHGCAVDGDGKAWCWGDGRGRLGRSASGTPEPQALPLDGVVHIAAGSEHGCAVLDTGRVRCWGKNDRGQLGSTGKSTGLPVEVVGVAGARRVAVGFQHSCALLAGGDVACWGNDTYKEKKGVRAVQLDEPAKKIAAGAEHDCALLASGRLTCWGRRPPMLRESCR